jgi:hypothetical protein
MAQNSLDPGFLILYYTRSSLYHRAVYQIAFAGTPTPGVEPNILDVTGDAIGSSTAVTAWITLIKARFNSDTTFTGYEVWSKASPSSDPIFIYGDDYAVVGTNVNNALSMGQVCLSFRTVGGGVMKLYFMESTSAANQKIACRVGAADWGSTVTFVLGDGAWMYGRDDERALSGIWITTKTNDALRKRRLNLA